MAKSKVIYIKDAEKPNETPFYEQQWFKVFGRLATSFIENIPPLRRYIAKSIPYLQGRIPKMYRNGQYIEALELSLSGLLRCYKKDEIHQYWWWSFMSYAVYCAQFLENAIVMNGLVKIAQKGYEPFEGREVAYCFCHFSHFKFTKEDYDSAIRFAELAKKADDDSGEAFYLLGYYDLFINGKDPVHLLSAAIERDHKILARIVHHPSFKEFPNIIEKLKELHLVISKQSPNKPIKQMG